MKNFTPYYFESNSSVPSPEGSGAFNFNFFDQEVNFEDELEANFELSEKSFLTEEEYVTSYYHDNGKKTPSSPL